MANSEPVVIASDQSTVPVSLASVPSHAVTNAGTFAVQSTNQSGDNVIGRVKITDGTDVADVLDLTNSNPIAVGIVDGNGDQITSFGGGTQYTEDAAAAANPVGTALNLIRADSLAGLTTADGDNVAARGTDKGELYVKHSDKISIYSIDAGDNNIGNVDVVSSALPTGASTAAKQPALGTAGTASTDVITVQGIASMTALKVDGSDVTQPVDTELPAAAALADDTANPTVPSVGALNIHFDGSTWDRTRGVNGHQQAAAGVLTGNNSVTSATTLFSADFTGYDSMTVQVTSAGTSCTITYEGSNDNATWKAVPMYNMASLTATAATTSTAAGIYGSPMGFRYFRARVSTYGSGTVTVYYFASNNTFVGPARPANLGGQTLSTVSTLTNITNWGNLVDNAAFTDGTTRLMMGGYIFDETAGTALTENDGAASRIDSKRAQVMVVEDATTRGQRASITTRGSGYVEGPTAADAAIAANPTTVGGRASDTVPTAMSAGGDVVNAWFGLRGEQITSLEPKAFGGSSLYRSIDLDESEEEVKATAGTLYGWFIFNAAASTRYVKIYNATAANVTVGTTTPLMTIPIPAGAGSNVEFTNGIKFDTAISIAATTGVADSDTGAPAANDVIMNVTYK